MESRIHAGAPSDGLLNELDNDEVKQEVATKGSYGVGVKRTDARKLKRLGAVRYVVLQK